MVAQDEMLRELRDCVQQLMESAAAQGARASSAAQDSATAKAWACSEGLRRDVQSLKANRQAVRWPIHYSLARDCRDSADLSMRAQHDSELHEHAWGIMLQHLHTCAAHPFSQLLSGRDIGCLKVLA